MQLNLREGQKVIELGGGAYPMVRPNVDCRPAQNENGEVTVDFIVNFEDEHWPISSGEFDAVLARFVLEHISYPKVDNFLNECHRILAPGGKLVIAIPNTVAQLEWVLNNQQGWDGKDFFTSASEILYGTQDYEANAHKSFFSPDIITDKLHNAGFTNISVRAYGARHTDMVAEGAKPVKVMDGSTPVWAEEHEPYVLDEREAFYGHYQAGDNKLGAWVDDPVGDTGVGVTPSYDPKYLFDKEYFDGGTKVGGYANEGYRDFIVNEVTAQKVCSFLKELGLTDRPKVLEIGCARGYVLKRLQDEGCEVLGLEASKHCTLTRACQGVIEFDITQTPWPLADDAFDLCYSKAVLEHIPRDKVDAVVAELCRVSKHQYHGIDDGAGDDGFDRTHFTLMPIVWWHEQFARHRKKGASVRLTTKEDIESGELGPDIVPPTNSLPLKLNLGSFTQMFARGWLNVDVIALHQFAQANGCHFLQHDLRNGLPFDTGSAELIYTSHCLEHFSYDEGLKILKECRRVLAPGGVIRVIVPDAHRLLTDCYVSDDLLAALHEVSRGAEAAPTNLRKVWELLLANHGSVYDGETLEHALREAGFSEVFVRNFRESCSAKMLRETVDSFPCLSLYVEAVA